MAETSALRARGFVYGVGSALALLIATGCGHHKHPTSMPPAATAPPASYPAQPSAGSEPGHRRRRADGFRLRLFLKAE